MISLVLTVVVYGMVATAISATDFDPAVKFSLQAVAAVIAIVICCVEFRSFMRSKS